MNPLLKRRITSSMMDRREMLKKTAVVAGSICLCKAAVSNDLVESTCCITPEIEPDCLTFKTSSVVIDLGKTETLGKNGQAVYVDYPEKEAKMIVVRVKKNRYYALSRLCTHGGQALSYIQERGVLQCNSYNHSIFSLDGSVWKGPAPAAIRTYDILKGKNSLEIYV